MTPTWRTHPLLAGPGGIARRPGLLGLEAVLLFLPLGLFLLWPLAESVTAGFRQDGRWSLYWLGRIWQNDVLLDQMVNGLALACTCTLLSLLLAVPLAVLRARCRFRGQGILGLAVLVPMILPPFVGAVAMKRFLARFGVLNAILLELGILQAGPGQLPPNWLESGFWGVVCLQALHLFPILYLNASAALANVDPAYTAAARNLGAGPVRTFFTVTLPLMRPGLFAGGTIVFIWSLTDIGTPLILQYSELIPVTIFNELKGGDYTGRTFSLVFLLLSGSVGLYLLGKFVFGRAIPGGGSKSTTQAQTRRLGLLGTLGAWALFGGVILVSLLPHVGVVLLAVTDRWFLTILPESYTLEHLAAVLDAPATYNSIVNSLRYAGLSTTIDIALGSLAAWLIIRARAPLRNALDGLCMLPLAVPGLILAAGYVSITVPGSWLESIGPTRNPFVLLVIAYSVRRLPFVVRGVSAGLQQVPESLEEAARNLGASKLRTAWKITVPLILANVIAAGVLTFSFAMLEVSDSLVLAQKEIDYPITKQIYEMASGQEHELYQAAALGVYGMGLLAGTMALASLLLGRRLGAIFRA